VLLLPLPPPVLPLPLPVLLLPLLLPVPLPVRLPLQHVQPDLELTQQIKICFCFFCFWLFI
jgi:hypothetical protein